MSKRFNETGVLQSILIRASAVAGCKVFRNNVGNAWVANRKEKGPGWIKLFSPRWIQFGLCPGSSDIIGWRTVTITDKMVGEEVAVFLALEVKKPKKKSTATKDQLNFLQRVNEAGGIGVIVTSPEEAVDVLGRPF